MKILMIARALPTHRKGGVPDHAWMLARGIAARGAAVHIMTTRLEGAPAEVAADGVTVHHLPGTRPDSYAGGWWGESTRNVARLHRDHRFDLLHCQSTAGYAVVNGGVHRSIALPALVSQHGTCYDELVTRWRNGFSADPRVSAKNVAALGVVAWRFLRSDRPYLRNADGVIATSEEQRRQISRVYGVPDDRLHTVYNGMDLSLFTPGPPDPSIRSRHGLGADGPLLLCVARLIRDKGVQNVIRAMPGVLRRHPSCRLLVVGDGPWRPALERLAAGNGAGGAIAFAGEVGFEALPAHFRTCDLFVNATNQQNGYDLTMVAAMACGRTVVASDIGSTPTLIADGVDGLLVPVADAGALTDAVCGLLDDPARRASIGTAARAKVLGGFGLEGMVEGTLAVYRRLLGEGR